MLFLVSRRAGLGVFTLFVVTLIVFLATDVLPGNAAYAILGHSATPARLHAVEAQLHLNGNVLARYWTWVSSLVRGKPGNSLATGSSVWAFVRPRILNSAFLVFIAGGIGCVLGVAIGAAAAVRRDSWFDHVTSALSLAVTALPEFVVAIALIILFSTLVLHAFPAVAVLPPGTYAWNQPEQMVLPVATLVLVTVPYIHRMMRAALIESLESEYVEMARLKGVPRWRVVLLHAVPSAVPPTIQVIGLTYLYLAGGIVVVETVFNFPGVGQGLVNAVSDRDIPVIQFIVVLLAAFYVVMNILTDVIALAVSPRRRLAR